MLPRRPVLRRWQQRCCWRQRRKLRVVLRALRAFLELPVLRARPAELVQRRGDEGPLRHAEHREEQGEELFAKYIDRSLIWLRASGLSEMLGLSPRNDTLVNRSLTTSSVFDPFTVDSVPAGWFGDEDDVPSDSVRLGVILDPDFDEYQAGF